MQAARVSYCDQVGLSSVDPQASPGFMVASSTCQFRQPLRYPDDITVSVRVDWMKNSSFQLSYLICNAGAAIVAEASDVLVVYNHREKRKMEIPGALREAICAIEGHSL